MSYRTRLPGGMMKVVTFDNKGNKVVSYEPPKKKKSKK